MKYVAWVGLFAAGLTVGYLVGVNNVPEPEETPVSTTEFIKETVVDTIIQTETVEVPVKEDESDTLSEEIDTSLSITDTLILIEDIDTTASEEDIKIRTEKMVGYRWLTVDVLEQFAEKDSLIKEMLDINDKMPTRLKVEFWESPLNFSGYKLSRSKLVLYGMPSQLEYKLYRRLDKYYLSTQSFYYSLKETEEFLPYLEVSKEEVFE
jgi:hypothetical protein